ncbi:MAG: trkH1 [Clostridia bacterium]|jgi:trk system potassium uptake protein TrkH|nr:trkH1 [Clostridia bacterium]
MQNSKDDLKILAYYMGKIVIGVGLLLIVPIITGIVVKELSALVDFIISFLLFMIVGLVLEMMGQGFRGTFRWIHGLVISALSWIILMFLSALPYWLSGHFLSYLDAMFDVMSGFTTTGLALIQNLDHVSITLNMWRHVLTFVGGQGMVVLALSFLITKGTGTLGMYVGEAKDEKLLPNVTDTAKAIWFISLIYLIIGTIVLTFAGIQIGLRPSKSFLHGLWVFMAAWSTGGFAPQSQNILYYHSTLYETITIIFFVIGSFNFALHHAIWKGNKKEIYKNIEIISFISTLIIITTIAVELFKSYGLYNDTISIFRRVFYQIISAHTTTGFMTIYARQFLYDWGGIGIVVISIAMLIGGSASSTAGGIKGIRIGFLIKALLQNMKKAASPEKRVYVEKYHFNGKNVLSDDIIKNALLIIVLYFITFIVGVIATLFSGYNLEESFFEAASITGNVGLSIGVTSTSMPSGLKVTYIIMMWLARLEFISAFAFIWTILNGVRKTCGKLFGRQL